MSDIVIDQFDDERVFAPSRRRLTAGLVLTIVIVAFEGLAVSTIMPIAVLDLHGLALYAWSFSGFMLGSLVGTVASGEYADRSGRRTRLSGRSWCLVAGCSHAGPRLRCWSSSRGG